MSDKGKTIWGIHAGRSGEADELFLKEGFVALGWSNLGDLSKLAADRSAFKNKVREIHPDAKDGQIAAWAGLLYRFVHEMKPGDYVAYPSKGDRQIHLGRIEGDYRFDSKPGRGYANVRAVKWLKAFPRSHFTQGALYEIGSAMSLFQIRNYAEEFLAAIEGKAAPSPDVIDPTIVIVAKEIEEMTFDFVVKRLAQETKGHPFAQFVAHLLNTMGYKTRVSPAGPDGGIDIVAHKDELGFEPPIIKVQCKATEGSIGDPVVSALYGKVDKDEFGLVVTLGTFTPPAVTFARSKPNLRLIDGEELAALIFEHYEQFDSRHKALLPMRRVYVPEPVDEAAG